MSIDDPLVVFRQRSASAWCAWGGWRRCTRARDVSSQQLAQRDAVRTLDHHPGLDEEVIYGFF